MTMPRQATAAFAVCLLVGLAAAGGARADSFTWTTTGQPSHGTSPNSSGILGNWTAFDNTTNSSSALSLSAEGYEIIANGSSKFSTGLQQLLPGGTNHAGGTNGAFDYTGSGFGIGVTDQYESGSSPSHTVSNEAKKVVTVNGKTTTTQVTDVVIFQLPQNMTITSIKLNQFCSNGSAGAKGCTGGPTGNDNVSVFLGTGNATNNLLSLASFQSKTLNNLLSSTYSFTQLTNSNPVTPNTGTNGSGNRTVSFAANDLTGSDKGSSSVSGNFLIIAASLSDGLGSVADYFKIASITASSLPPTQV